MKRLVNIFLLATFCFFTLFLFCNNNNANADVQPVSICIGATSTERYTTGNYQVNRISSSDESIVSATYEITGMSFSTQGMVYTVNIDFTGKAKGEASITLYSGIYNLGTIQVTVKDHEICEYPATDPTCLDEGNLACWRCTDCGMYFDDEDGTHIIELPILPALGHTEEIIPAMKPTKTEVGSTEGKKCSVCGAILVPTEEIPKVGATICKGYTATRTYSYMMYVNGVVSSDPSIVSVSLEEGSFFSPTVVSMTGLSKGMATITISGNNLVLYDNDTVAEFTVIVDDTKLQEPTYIWSDLNDSVTATAICNNDDAHEISETVETTSEVIKKASCEVEGEIKYTAKFMNDLFTEQIKTEIIPVEGHTLTSHILVEPTCTEAGTEAYWLCDICGELFSDAEGKTEIEEPVIIPADGHRLTKTVKNDATCTEAGTEAYWTCEVCRKVFSDQNGEKEIKKPVVIAATGHDLKKNEKVEATEDAEGTEEYWECTVCKKLFSDKDGKNEIDKPVIIPKLEPKDKVVAFVTRCYKLILCRDADQAGLRSWTEALKAKDATAAQIIDGFTRSPEFMNRSLSASDTVDILFKVMMNRQPKEREKSDCLDSFSKGYSLQYVINGLLGLSEFTNFCNESGILPGSLEVEPVNPEPSGDETPDTPRGKIEAFVKRCYRLIMNQEPDAGGLQGWSDALELGAKTAAEVINDIVNSSGFANRKLSNGETVEIMYQTMLGRSADENGKAGWVDTLNQGYTLQHMINGFSGSAEFSSICAEYGVVPGTINVEPVEPAEPEPVNPDPVNPEPSGDEIPDTPRGKIETFVKRCYQLILNRNADQGGLQGWSDALETGTSAAANIIDSFVRSDEFVNRNVSNSESVDILYKTMLNRPADEGGKAGWTDALDQGYTLQDIINGFCGSAEFTALCKDFGIEPGIVNVNPVNPEPASDTPRGKIEAFVKRCYKLILNRDADEGGLKGWSDALETGAGQACQIIDGFVRSPEYINRNLGYAESVDILYLTMLDRAADEGGKVGWVDALNQGYTLQHIINGFCGSAEFTNICNEFGITAGNLLVQGVIVKREAITPEGEEEAPVVYVNYTSEYTNEEKVRAFVEHCYEAVFGREGDAEGVEAYTRLILDGKKTPKRVAYEFIFSEEFQNQLPGNEAFIRILYRLYFNRDADAEGLAMWVAQLESGISLEEIVNGFVGSQEFKAIESEMKR